MTEQEKVLDFKDVVADGYKDELVDAATQILRACNGKTLSDVLARLASPSQPGEQPVDWLAKAREWDDRLLRADCDAKVLTVADDIAATIRAAEGAPEGEESRGE